MKKRLIAQCVFLVAFLVGGIALANDSGIFRSVTANSGLDAPTLMVSTAGTTLSLYWTPVAGATGYTLYYAPSPYTGPDSIGSIPLGTQTAMSASLWEGAAFFVAVQAYDSVESSGYSNIELFMINGSDSDYTMTILGTLGGYSAASAINDSGQVVGASRLINAYNLPTHAFLWQNGTMADLGTLPGGDDYSLANGINNAGQIVGTSTRDGGNSGDGPLRAFLYQNGTMIDLGTLGGKQSEAMGINDFGQVVGYASIEKGDLGHFQYSRAFLWENGIMTNLGTLGGYSSASAVNNSGDVVGNSYTSISQPTSGPRHSFLWTNGIMTDLGTLGGNDSFAYGINEYCQIVGTSNITTSDYHPLHAFLWQNGTMTDLGTLGGSNSLANAINDSGQVVGHSNLSGTWESHAFLWENGTMYDLNDLVGSGSTWTLVDALDINQFGQIACTAVSMQGEKDIAVGVLLTPCHTSIQTAIRHH